LFEGGMQPVALNDKKRFFSGLLCFGAFELLIDFLSCYELHPAAGFATGCTDVQKKSGRLTQNQLDRDRSIR
jgi:hypothetical protein